MNPIITKCLKELDSDTPRLDYMRGMLETLLELQAHTPINAPVIPMVQKSAPVFINGEQVDESSPILNSYLRGGTGTVSESVLP